LVTWKRPPKPKRGFYKKPGVRFISETGENRESGRPSGPTQAKEEWTFRWFLKIIYRGTTKTRTRRLGNKISNNNNWILNREWDCLLV